MVIDEDGLGFSTTYSLYKKHVESEAHSWNYFERIAPVSLVHYETVELPQAGLDLKTSDFPVLHPTTELTHNVLSATEI